MPRLSPSPLPRDHAQLAGVLLTRVLPPGLARRVRTLPHAVGGEVDEPITSAITFKLQFRADYGPVAPDFLEVSHKEALRMAQVEGPVARTPKLINM